MSATIKDQLRQFCQQQGLEGSELAKEISEALKDMKTPEESLGISSAEYRKIMGETFKKAMEE